MEVLATFAAVLAAITGVLAYWRKYVSEPADTRRHLAVVFESAHSRNSQLLSDLREYASSNDAYADHFMQGFSFQDAIQLLEQCEQEMFSDENLRSIRNSSGSGRNIESILERIKKHDQYVVQSLTHFRQVFQKGRT